MPKSIIIEPERVFATETIEFSAIPVNAYHKTIHEERAAFSREDFLAIWRDMCAIREFETVLNEIKTKGTYKGVTYNHAGPAHLSIGQEAIAQMEQATQTLATTSEENAAASEEVSSQSAISLKVAWPSQRM